MTRTRPAGYTRLVTTDGTCPLPHGRTPDGQPTAAPQLRPDRYLCHHCTVRLRRTLEDLPSLMADLEITLARQLRIGYTDADTAWPQTTAATPLPFDLRASEAGWVARMTILANVDWVAGIRGHTVPQSWLAIATYLTDAVDWIARHPDGPQVVDEILAATRQARAAIDRPADRVYVGRCGALIETPEHLAATDCAEELYARADRTDVTCPRCGTTWDVHQRQAAMLEQLRDHVLPAVDIARAVAGLGRDITPELIRQWKRRRLLAPAHDEQGRPRATTDGRPLYRVGDVLDLVAQRAVSAAGGSVPS